MNKDMTLLGKKDPIKETRIEKIERPAEWPQPKPKPKPAKT